MDINRAASILAALGHPGRLKILMTVRAAKDGMAAGDIVTAVDALQNTVSGQLKVLTAAGLLIQERHAQKIIYRVDHDMLRAIAKLVAI